MRSKLSILFVDDDHEDHFIIKNSFNEIGYPDVLDCLDDGLELFRYLDEREAEALPTLIILDMNMPRVNGLDTLRMLKNNPIYQNIPVVVFSTSVNECEMRECLKIGAVAYFSKPGTYQESLLVARNIYGHALDVAQAPSSQALWG